jgi:hypothetical protein
VRLNLPTRNRRGSKLTSSYFGKRVKKECRANKAKEVADCGAESGTLPTQSDSNEQAASIPEIRLSDY